MKMFNCGYVEEYKEGLRAIYSHIRWVEDCSREEDAKSFVAIWRNVIDLLSKEHLIYERLSPEYDSYRDFEENKVHYIARCRFSIGPKK